MSRLINPTLLTAASASSVPILFQAACMSLEPPIPAPTVPTVLRVHLKAPSIMPNIQMMFTKCPFTMNPELTIQDPQKSDPTPLSNLSGDYALIRTTYYKQRGIVTPHNQKCHMQGYFSFPFLECMPLYPPPFSISSFNLTLPPRVNNSILNQALYPQKQPGSNLTSM